MHSTMRWGVLLGMAAASVELVMACGSKGAPELSASLDGGKEGSIVVPPDGPTSVDPEAGSIAGQLDAAPDSDLPALPTLTNVVVTEREDSVGIDFDPVDDAVDYRVYPLPAPSDVTVNSDGSLTIKNAVYRCAGLRQALDLPNNTENSVTNPDAGQAYVNGQYSWTAEIPTMPTLGYVNVTPGPGLLPVYAIAIHPTAPEVGWRESRPKVYTTDASLRQTLLTQGGRDDGIVFYVPATASSATQTIYHSETATVVAGQGWTQYTEYYFASADMASHAQDTTPPAPAFQVLSAPGSGTKPLMNVLYNAGQNHVELSPGTERFKRAANQGPGPLWHLEWSGIAAPTTLVVEALASGCPYQGFLSPQSLNAPPHQTFFTLEQMQQASATGEIFINGEYDLPGATWSPIGGETVDAGLPLLRTPSASPVPLARSFVAVTPQPHDPSAWDWYEGFSAASTFGPATPASDTASCSCQTPGSPPPCNSGGGACGYWASPTLDFGAYETDNPNNVAVFTYGQFLGEFWDAFDDWSQDVTSTLRFTATQMATVGPDTFLHVTWTVNTVGTDRRYPQLIVTDQGSPIQDGFKNPSSNFLLLQTILGPSMRLEIEAFHGLFNGKPWAVNNQAPNHNIIDYDNWNTGMTGIPASATGQPIPPADPPFEHAGMDRMTKYDAYISSSLLYVFMDGAPAGCTQYPTNGFALDGPVTVTFGDVLYHEGAPDELVCAQPKPYAFLHEHQCTETKRHWDDLGFKSGVSAPAWNATTFPCVPY
jgi:hypothetical protein